jgi:hypothetical protein
VNDVNLGSRIIEWASANDAIQLLVVIGSQARRMIGSRMAADRHSDWDFQIATSAPDAFKRANWTQPLGLDSLAYVHRRGRLGSVNKVTAVFAQGELDLVIMPYPVLMELGRMTINGVLPEDPTARQALIDLATVLQGGYRIIKGREEFGSFFDFVARSVPTARLSDDLICEIANGFVCDYVSTLRKIQRGENIAAQRWLHLHLVEINLRLIHELRQREGAVTFPDGRRLESARDPRVAAISVEAILDGESLRRAAERSAGACRELVLALVGHRWTWPQLDGLNLDSR